MSAEVLCRAASLMRERAEKARSGDGELVANVWHHDLMWMSKRYEVIATDEGSIIAEGLDRWSAEHIASWHPAVALAVADWLEVVAGYGKPGKGSGTRNWDAALAVARAYLGES